MFILGGAACDGLWAQQRKEWQSQDLDLPRLYCLSSRILLNIMENQQLIIEHVKLTTGLYQRLIFRCLGVAKKRRPTLGPQH